MNLDQAGKYYKFIKERPLLFAGSHDAVTSRPIVEAILDSVIINDRPILVLYNIEFVISLILNYNIVPEQITFFADHKNKVKIARKLNVNSVTSMEDINMKSRPVLLTNPPYTNGEQDASEIYTEIISTCIDKFDPIAIGAVTPENMINGGQKKKTLRDKILKTHGLKTVRFLNQTRDWQGKIKVDTALWVTEENYTGNTVVTSRHFDQSYIVSKPLSEYVDEGTQVIHDWLQNAQTADKIKLRTGKKTERTGAQIKISKDYKDNWVAEPGYEYTSHNTEWRVAFGYMRCNTCAVVPPGIGIPGKYRYLNFGSSESNARKFASYMNSEPIRFILKLTYTSRTLDNPQLSHVPLIDLTQFKSINNQALYQYWNIDATTQSEIRSIVGDEVPF